MCVYVCVCVCVCAFACARLNGSESETGYILSIQLECPLPAVWWLLGKNCYETASSLLWYSMKYNIQYKYKNPFCRTHITPGTPCSDGEAPVGCWETTARPELLHLIRVCLGWFYIVPTENCVQGVHGGELCAYDSLCSLDDLYTCRGEVQCSILLLSY